MNYIKQWLLSLCLSVLLAIGISAQPKTPTSWRHDNARTLWLSRDGSILLSEAPAPEPAHQIRIWDVARHRLAGDLPLAKGQGGSVLALSDDGRHLVVRREVSPAYHAAGASLVRCEVWTLSASGARARLAWKVVSRKQEAVMAAAFQGTNGVLLWPERIETRNAHGRVLRRVGLKAKKDLSEFASGALSPDGRFAILSHDSLWQLFGTRSGEALRTLQMLPSNSLAMPVTIEFSYDGRTVTGTTGEMVDRGLGVDVQIITDRWVWDVKFGKILAHWENIGTYRPPFSPDGRALLRRHNPWDHTDSKSHEPLEFEDLVTHKSAAFQIPHPWGKDDDHWLLDVRVSGDGKVVVALDDKGNIWLQNSRHKN